MTKNTRLISLLLATTLVMNVGCSMTGEKVGKPINFAKLERVTLGISTQETVKQVFGYPQEVLYPDTRTIYQYRYYDSTQKPHIKQAIDFVFNKQQRLVDITINDAIGMGSEKNDKSRQ
ncbi:hypothetical protein QTV44_002604 [Vibrio vulnificus]|nr:hypothetical protein [Vibrio vulnificus]